MKKIFLASIILVLFGCTESAFAQDSYRLGIGVRLSNSSPTLNNSVSVKYFVTDQNALEGLISFGSRFGIGGLYEVHNPVTSVQGLKWFYGAGGYLGFQDGSTYLGPTGVIGLDYKFPNFPVNLSLDWKPELDILPKINFVPDGFGFTARFTLQ